MRPLSITDEDKRINERKVQDEPHTTTLHNCIRCKKQYKLTVPYEKCVPVNRDFCDACLALFDYHERLELVLEFTELPAQSKYALEKT